jgi:putative ABC transport system ATP-binding protein
MTDAIVTEKLRKSYRSPIGRLDVIKDVNLRIEKGEAVAFTGPSGCGKTTLINLLSGLVRPSSGRLTVYGKEIARLSEHFLVEFRRKTAGIVFQQFNLIPGLSTLENVTIPLLPAGLNARKRKELGMNLLARLKLEDRADFSISRLSGGEQQRAALGRALVNDPSLLFCDEPTSNIDHKTSETMIALFHELRGEGKTLILATHHQLILDSGLCNRIFEVSKGSVE